MFSIHSSIHTVPIRNPIISLRLTNPYNHGGSGWYIVSTHYIILYYYLNTVLLRMHTAYTLIFLSILRELFYTKRPVRSSRQRISLICIPPSNHPLYHPEPYIYIYETKPRHCLCRRITQHPTHASHIN